MKAWCVLILVKAIYFLINYFSEGWDCLLLQDCSVVKWSQGSRKRRLKRLYITITDFVHALLRLLMSITRTYGRADTPVLLDHHSEIKSE